MIREVPRAEEEGYLPRVLPVGWVRLPFDAGPAFENLGFGPLRGVRVLASVAWEEDGRRWLHVSLSRRDRIPSWEDTDAVKRIFVGDDRYAYEVHPPRALHYTSGIPGRGSHVLHLWAPLEGEPPLPDFLRARGGTL